jgi:4-amino-4-deoxy-L-arabinose transferase-like glycosyltransferase
MIRKIALSRALPTGKISPAGLFFAALFVLTLLRVLWLAASPLPLYGDEAQYWTWAQHPDWGYYSKPPLLAWLIALTTAMGEAMMDGDSEFWVRLGSPLLHAGTAVAVYLLAGRMFADRALAAWCGVAYATLPAVFLSSTLISTDVPLLFCWAWGLYGLWRGLEGGACKNGACKNGACKNEVCKNEVWRWWLVCGVCAGLALLAKYAAAAFWLSAFLAMGTVPAWRGWLRRPQPWVALTLSMLILFQNVLWNARHGFVTFLHTRDNANLGGGPRFEPGELLAFVGGQFGVMGPVLFAVLLWAMLWQPWRRWARDQWAWEHQTGAPVSGSPLLTAQEMAQQGRAYRLLLHFSWPLLAIMSVQALLSRANANWAAAAYVSAVVLAGALLWRGRSVWCNREVLLLSTLVHTALAVVVLLLPLDTELNLSGRIDPFRRLKGYDRLVAAVADVAAAKPGVAILTDDRMLTAQLMYYGRDGRLPPVVKWNPDGQSQDYFEMTTDIRRFDHYLVVMRDPPTGIAVRFRAVTPLPMLDIPTHRDRGLRYYLWEMQGFAGYR